MQNYLEGKLEKLSKGLRRGDDIFEILMQALTFCLYI